MPDQHSASHPLDPSAVAAYIADVVSSLAGMARRQKFDALGYLLEMARMEAETLSTNGCPRDLGHSGDGGSVRSRET